MQILLFSLMLIVHGALALVLAVFWIRSGLHDLRHRGMSFQFRIMDVYPGIVGLLPWLWLLSLAIQELDDPRYRDWGNLGGQVWGLFHLILPLGTGWAMGVINVLLDDPERKKNFLSAGLTIIVHQIFAVAVFVLFSIVYFVVVVVIVFFVTR